ncbi:MAG: hypothetical protein GY817_05335 [bacterium]|nr:hypothetical protein [bacterium]
MCKINLKKSKKLKILISNGPTRIYLDPIRYITNISSGKMGASLARAACQFAEVCVVNANVNRDYADAEVLDVETNTEMLEVLTNKIEETNIFISVAAVVDFEPIRSLKSKIKNIKQLKFKATVDILKTLALNKRSDQMIVGFALETENLLENALVKLREKNLDIIIANRASESMEKDRASVIVIAKDGRKTVFEQVPKDELAHNILDIILANYLWEN